MRTDSPVSPSPQPSTSLPTTTARAPLHQFFIAYQIGNVLAGETWIDDHRKVVRNYLCSWFPLDALTVFLPGTFDVFLGSLPIPEAGLKFVIAAASAAEATTRSPPTAATGEEGERSVEEMMGVLRVLRALRLIKLARLVKASRMLDRWRSRVTLSHSAQTMIRCVLLLLFFSHWFACSIALQASLHSSVHQTLAGTEMYALCDEPSAASSAAGSSAESVLAECSGLGIEAWYLACYSWSIMVIMGTGNPNGGAPKSRLAKCSLR